MLTSLLFAFSLNTADACPMQDAAASAEAKANVEATAGAKATFAVEGMSCGDCSQKVTAALNEIEGVNAAAVDYQTGTAHICYDDSKTDKAALQKAIEDTGYKAKDSNA